MNEEARKRISVYYELLTQKENKPLATLVMKKLTAQLSDDDIVILEERLSLNDSAYKRLTAYATALSSLMAKEKPVMVKEASVAYGIDSQGKNTTTMNELLSALGDYDMEQEISEEINGNTFAFKRTFPIEKYREDLFAIGDEEKGNRWYVKLSNDGKLVIY